MSEARVFGILRMKYEMAMRSELARRQYHDCAQEALDMIESLRIERDAIEQSLIRCQQYLSEQAEQSKFYIDKYEALLKEKTP